MNLGEIKYAYFLGIGGIGMSAIARYFSSNGITVAGYDKTPSELTEELEKEGMVIHFDDDVRLIPEFVHQYPSKTLLVYTPAVPADHRQFAQLKQEGRTFYKRSEVLGMISNEAFCIAVAGTHGKTTTSTLIAHLLYQADVNFTAFLGGISANYNTNYIHHTSGRSVFPGKPIVVLEADEFDRSFHRLNPDIATITAIDPDHLDIYGTKENFLEAFDIFISKIKDGGSLVVNSILKPKVPSNIQSYTYNLDDNASAFHGTFQGIHYGNFTFDFEGAITGKTGKYKRHLHNAELLLPGFHNVKNAIAALGVCYMLMDLPDESMLQGLKTFKGAKRRFEYVVKNDNYVVIDDYAHHPAELDAIISSVQAMYPHKKLTGIFQPHLFTRTKDFADGFAQSLSKLDELVLMDIYPAREVPLPGITSEWLLQMVPLQNKQLLNEKGILKKIQHEKPELLLILGAGDIDRIVPKVKEVYNGF